MKKESFLTWTSIDSIDLLLERLIKENKNVSLSRLYKETFRRYPIFGDYPIIAHCLNLATTNGIEYSRSDIFYVFKQSEELRELAKGEKMGLVDQLSIHLLRYEDKNMPVLRANVGVKVG